MNKTYTYTPVKSLSSDESSSDEITRLRLDIISTKASIHLIRGLVADALQKDKSNKQLQKMYKFSIDATLSIRTAAIILKELLSIKNEI